MSNSKILASMAVQISADNAKFNAALSQSEKHLGKFSKGMTALSGQLKGLVAGFGFYQIGREIIQTTSQFQKFSAVLSNTLGSESEAQRALNQIKDFATQTPFEVAEITAAYVRWANQGLDPTIDRMNKLGDVASSLGAGFEQTAEAFKDLMVGQTKRIEEVGISAQQANGKIQLSFKGVNIEIEKNAEGVQRALDIYSQLNGVLGTSDAVSKTLGGRIANLSDAWTNLMDTMGNSSSGPIFAVVESLTRITTTLANLGSELALIGQAISPFHDLSDVSRETLDYLMKFARTDTGKRLAEVLEPFTKQENRQFLLDYDKNLKAFVSTLQAEGESLEDINTLWKHYVERRIEAVRTDDQAASDKRKKDFKMYVDDLHAQADAAKQVSKELKDLEAWKKRAIAPLRTSVTTKEDASGDFNLGSGVFAQQANNISEVLKGLNGDLKLNANEFDIWWANVTARMQMAAESFGMDVGPAISGTISEIAAGFGAAAAGAANFGDVILKAMGGFMQAFGGGLIALGVGKKAFEKFSGPQMIAAGAVLVAAGSALQASIKNKPDLSSGGGGGAHSSGSSSGGGVLNGNLQDTRLTAETIIRGQDLYVVFTNYMSKNKYTKVGG